MLKWFIKLSLFFFALYACGSSGGSSESDEEHYANGSINFVLDWSSLVEASTSDPCSKLNIHTIKAQVFSQNNNLLSERQIPCSNDTITIENISSGSDLNLLLVALNQNQRILYQGQKNSFDLSSGKILGLGKIAMVPNFTGDWAISESFTECISDTANERQYNISIYQSGDTATVAINNQESLTCQVIEEKLHCRGSFELDSGRVRSYASYDLVYNGTDLEGEAYWNDTGGGCDACNGKSILGTGESSPNDQTPSEEDSLPATVTNRFSMTFNFIPADTFTMGSPEEEVGRDDDEYQHVIQLSDDYYIQTTEVTQAQWEDIVLAAQDLGLITEEDLAAQPSYFYDCGLDCPVESISYEDALTFIDALNQLEEDGTYNLPTEAQWEYATRAGTQTAFINGDISEVECALDPNLDEVGWYCGNSDETTHPVAQKLPNAFGLYDVHGNVYEWCQDWHGPYPISQVIDPVGPADGEYRIYRGGSWNQQARRSRSAYRNRYYPDYRESHVGLRLVWMP